jgi:CRP/FNR family transcriptional regulator, cyclic AMP receptor protein
VRTVSIPKVDPDLAAQVPARRRLLAARACQARVEEIPQGEWSGQVEGIDSTGLGLLVLSGVLCRRVGQGDSYGAELVGPGDLLRPWEHVGTWSSIPTEATWTAIETSELAVLDADFARRASRFPQIGSQLTGRALIRSRYLAIMLAIISQRKIETRLTMLFWHLADRFGQVRGEWVEVPIPLTHSILGELVAARRPSVSTALSCLQDRGTVVREDRGWRLQGTVPPELLEAEVAAAVA